MISQSNVRFCSSQRNKKFSKALFILSKFIHILSTFEAHLYLSSSLYLRKLLKPKHDFEPLSSLGVQSKYNKPFVGHGNLRWIGTFFGFIGFVGFLSFVGFLVVCSYSGLLLLLL